MTWIIIIIIYLIKHFAYKMEHMFVCLNGSINTQHGKNFFFCPLVVVVLDEILNKECKNQIVHAQAQRLTVFSFSSVW